MRTIAVIPARGGSKGIPHKNLQLVGGRSLIARCVAAAVSARSVERVLVSTDDADIADAARGAGAEIVQRPVEISGDTATSESALLHALEILKAEPRGQPDALLFMQATSPFTRSEDLDAAVAVMESKRAEVVFSVAESHTFQWDLDEEGVAAPVGHEVERRPRRQEMTGRCVETGSFYLMRVPGFLQNRHRFFGNVIGYRVPAPTAMEIDDAHDLEWARWLASRLDPQGLRLPSPLHGVVFDFDGVFTENTVYVDQDGREMIRASRGDGMGMELLRQAGIPAVVLSKEKNATVQQRCDKLKIPCIHGIDDKLPALQDWAKANRAELANLIYVGNDVNDVECLRAVGCGVAVADAHPTVLAAADHVLSRPGGRGAVRELCELIVASG